MKFIIDAHIPPGIAKLLNANGHDVKHTNELPDANETTDSEIIMISMAEKRMSKQKIRIFIITLY